MKALRILLCVVVFVALATNVFALDWLKINGEFRGDYDLAMTKDENGTSEGDDDVEETSFGHGGFAKMRIEAKVSSDSGWYAEAQSGVEVQADAVGTWERWLKVGNESFAIRVLMADIGDSFAKGQDTYIVEAPGAPGRYEGDSITDKGFSLHLSPGENIETNTTVAYTPDGDNNVFGIRPRVGITAGAISIQGAFEYHVANPQDNDALGSSFTYGGAANVEMGMDPITVGVAGGYSVSGGKVAEVVDVLDADGIPTGETVETGEEVDMDDTKTMSTFAYLKFGTGAGTLGVGGGYTALSYKDCKDESSMIEGYVSFEKGDLMGVSGLKFALAGSYAAADIKPDGGTDTTNTGVGGRIRFNYDMPAQTIIGE